MTHSQFATKLFELQVNTHITHLSYSGTLAVHMALDPLYNGLVGLIDRYVESAQSDQLVTGYGNITVINGANFKSYLTVRLKEIKIHRDSLTEGHLQQICDDICELISSALYKLNFIK